MRIYQLTAGTGNYYCGSCLRDQALVLQLRQRGHDVTLVPLYLPLVTEELDPHADDSVHLNGISVFLEQRFPVFSSTFPWMHRFLSSPTLLRFCSHFAGMTNANELGQLTISMLQGEQGCQAREIDRLLVWLHTQPPPDVICLSTSLLSGLANVLKQSFHVPIVCMLQGEDSFLDNLQHPYREQSWELLAQRCKGMDHFIAISHYFADFMRQRLGLKPEQIDVVYPGISVDEFLPAAAVSHPPVIGYLARMHPSKGLGILVDAFLQLDMPDVRLRIAGVKTFSDHPYVRSLCRRLKTHGCLDRVEFLPNLERHEKLEFLRQLSVLSVPATYGEAFGLYVLEALASGVPVVQPRHGAFPEILEQTGGGILCEPHDPVALASSLRQLLKNPEEAYRLGETGRKAVHDLFRIEEITKKFESVLRAVV